MTSRTADASRQLHVLALIDHFALGGAQAVLTRFAAASWRINLRMTISCLEELDGNPLAEPLAEIGLTPVVLGVTGRVRLGALRAVRRHIAEVRPHIVHTHLGTSDLLGGLAARSLGVPVVSTIHSTQWERRARVRRMLSRLVAARVIAVSESARQEYLRHGWGRPDQVVTIHNGIDVQPAPGAGPEVRAELGLTPDDLVVAMVSSIRPEKGHDVAIEAFRRLRSRYPRLRLLIVGDGDQSEELLRPAVDLDGGVFLAGMRLDVMRVLDAVDVCLHPSRADAFPTTILEAMAAGVPIVATAVGGIPEMVTHGSTGWLVPAPPEPAHVAEALSRLLEDPQLRGALARAARTDYRRRFTSEPWLRQTRAVYDSVLSGSSAARERAGRYRWLVRNRA